MVTSPVPAPSSLAEYLQEVTEALAASRTPQEIYRIVLHPALEALGGVAGTVLTLEDAGRELRLSAQHRFGDAAPDLWQTQPLHAPSPVWDALRRAQPLFFEDQAALVGQYPELITPGGAPMPLACAVAPLLLETRALGVLIIDFREPHTFTPQERRFLAILATQCALALDRTEQARTTQAQMQQRTLALDAFVAFSEAVGAHSDIPALAAQAIQTLQTNLTQVSAAYFELLNGRWQAQRWSADISPSVVAEIRAGVPEDDPFYAQGARSESGVFTDDWTAQDRAASSGTGTKLFRAAAFVPVRGRADGPPRALLWVGTLHAVAWTEPQRAVVRAVCRGLSLAATRGEAARQLSAQHAELASRTQVLEAFAQIAADLAAEVDSYALVRRAQEVVASLLPDGYLLYYEQEAGHWRNRVQTGSVRSSDLQAFIDAGPRVGQTPSVDLPWASRQALYQDRYSQGSDTPAEMVKHIWATASLPVLRQGQTVGMLIVVLFEQRSWTRNDKVVLETVAHHLGLALERSVQTQALESERAGLDAFAAFTEAVGDETDVLTLARQASRVVRASLTHHSFAYFELEGEVWKARVWSEDIAPEIVAQLKAGLLTSAPNVAQALRSGTPLFVGGWDAGSEHVCAATSYGAAAFIPLFVQGEVHALVISGTQGSRSWTAREQGVIRAVVRGLGLALERAWQARQLRAQRDELDARAGLLSAANEELEAFAYSVSHDLRTPVRHLMGFSALAQQAVRGAQHHKLERYLDVMHQSGLRMNVLIDSMLMLSRVGREDLSPRSVDLAALVAQACQDAQTEFAGRPVRWHIGALPQVWGDAGLLQQVMTNLLSNAVKYSAPRGYSEILVRAEDLGAAWVVSVEDNGVGFDAAYASRLFGVFQRLHREQDFAGTGVGLATVRRIVLKHGGQVFARSPGESGATFGFTLPKQPESSTR